MRYISMIETGACATFDRIEGRVNWFAEHPKNDRKVFLLGGIPMGPPTVYVCGRCHVLFVDSTEKTEFFDFEKWKEEN